MFTTVLRVGSRPCLVANHLVVFVGVVVASLLVLLLGLRDSYGAEDTLPAPVDSQLEATNFQGLLHAYLQLQEQLQATQLAIERNRQETKEAVARNAEALSQGLQGIQQSIAAQQARDLEAMQRSNKTMLIVVGTFAAMSFLTMLIMTCFQWRMSNGLADITAALPTALGLGAGPAVAARALAEPSALRLPGAAHTPEKRSHELEHHLHPVLTRQKGISVPIENPLFQTPGDSTRNRQLWALTMAVLVGLICALGVALLFYVVAHRKLGFE